MTKIIDGTKAFFIKIQSLYDIEKQLEKALPKLAKASTDPELIEGFLAHLEETKVHSERLEKIFEMLDVSPKKMKCEGIRGIVEDGVWVTEVDAPESLKDSMIAGAARYAEHYEMAGYISAIEEAAALGLDDAVELLTLTLTEEQQADKTLQRAQKKGLALATKME